MPSNWKDWLDFTHSERNGFILLMFIVVILTLLPRVYPLLIKEEPQDFTKIKRLLSEVEAQMVEDSIEHLKSKQDKLKIESGLKTAVSSNVEPFNFDPNIVPFEDLRKLGLSQKLSHTIINYRDKGGRFYKKEDLRKIYGLNDEEYNRLEDYILITNQEPDKTDDSKPKLYSSDNQESKEFQEEMVYEVNTVDSLSLLKIHGIGPSFTSRILKYRKLLGGYRSKSQLLEVYGMDSARWEKLIETVEVDTSKIEKIPINSAEWIDLVRHPYINKETANNIVNHRKYETQFVEVSDLKNYYLVNKQLYRKIAPYLKIDDRVEAKKTD